MLKTRLIHPQILEALGQAGHGSKVVIGDGNYPFGTHRHAQTPLVNLNVSPGLVSATQALELLATVVPFEAAGVMQVARSGPYAMEEDPPIWETFRQILRSADHDLELNQLDRQDFYDQAASREVALMIATGEQRIYADLILTIGVVMPES